MNNIKFCKLCFNFIKDNNFEIIEDAIKDILDVLFVKIDFQEGISHVTCKICFKKLLETFDFKSTCVYTDAAILSYVNDNELSRLDIKDVYLKERGRTNLSEEQKICRLCLQLTGDNFLSLKEMDINIFQKFFPEINMNIVNDPVVCKTCFDLFHEHGRFLNNCLDVSNRNKLADLSRKGDQRAHSLFDCYIELENLKINELKDVKVCLVKLKCKENERMTIKTEEIFIKSEDEQDSNVEDMEDQKESMQVCSKSEKDQTKTLATGVDSVVVQTDNQGKSQFRNSLVYPQARPFKYKKRPKVMRKCSNCDFKTTDTGMFRRHKLKHSSSSEEEFFICNTCGFKARYKINLERHFLKHRKWYEVETYKCGACNFSTKYKLSWKKHIKTQHKKPSEVQMYKCDLCDHKTKYKDNLLHHQLKHKNFTEVHIYRCDSCNFESKYRESHTKHMRKHKSLSEIQIFKCDSCDFGTKYRESFQRHVKKHSAEEPIYKCDLCDYETVYKGNLTKHQITHKNPSEVRWYKCDNCDHETIYKANFLKHEVLHKNSSLRVHKCRTCDYKTKSKERLKTHLLTHNGTPEVRVF